MPETIRFEGLSLPVSDVSRSVAFYQQLGFQVEQSSPVFALLRLGEGSLGLLRAKLSDETQQIRGRIHVELSTENLDALYEQLKSGGLTFNEPPHDEPWERAMSTPDPDGYHVEIAQGRRGHNAPEAQA